LDGLLFVNTIELFLFGFAAVVDLALLLALWERVNRGRVAIWLTILVASTTLIHGSVFVRLVISEADGESFAAFDRFLVATICAGLLLLPSAMLHAAIRLNHTGIDAYPPADHRYRWLYLPMLFMPWISFAIQSSPAVDFVTHVAPWRMYYLVFLVFMNTASTCLFLRLRRWNLTPRSSAAIDRSHVALGGRDAVRLAFDARSIVAGCDGTHIPLRGRPDLLDIDSSSVAGSVTFLVACENVSRFLFCRRRIDRIHCVFGAIVAKSCCGILASFMQHQCGTSA